MPLSHGNKSYGGSKATVNCLISADYHKWKCLPWHCAHVDNEHANGLIMKNCLESVKETPYMNVRYSPAETIQFLYSIKSAFERGRKKFASENIFRYLTSNEQLVCSSKKYAWNSGWVVHYFLYWTLISTTWNWKSRFPHGRSPADYQNRNHLTLILFAHTHCLHGIKNEWLGGERDTITTTYTTQIVLGNALSEIFFSLSKGCEDHNFYDNLSSYVKMRWPCFFFF